MNSQVYFDLYSILNRLMKRNCTTNIDWKEVKSPLNIANSLWPSVFC